MAAYDLLCSCRPLWVCRLGTWVWTLQTTREVSFTSVTPLSLYLPFPRSAVPIVPHHSPTYSQRAVVSVRAHGSPDVKRPHIINCWHPTQARKNLHAVGLHVGVAAANETNIHSFNRLALSHCLGGASVPFSPHSFFPRSMVPSLIHPSPHSRQNEYSTLYGTSIHEGSLELEPGTR